MVTLKALARVHALARGRRESKSVLRQWAEMIALLVVTGNGPNYYQLAGFWKRTYRWSEMSRHISARAFTAHVNRVNPPEYHKLGQSKIAEKAILTLLGIPTPRFIGVLDVSLERSGTPCAVASAQDLDELLSRDPAERVAFKLIEGHSGLGFMAAQVIRAPSGLRLRPLDSDGDITVAQFVDEKLDLRPGNPRLIEEYLVQDPDYGAFNPSSVNTIRPWTIIREGRARTLFAYFRMGRRGSLVDNIWAGGIVAPVDLETGRMAAAHDGEPTRRTFVVHPDSGVRIEGAVLPHFREAIALAERSVLAFPHITFSGLDIAMSPGGPVVIETNVLPAREGAAFVGYPTRDAFIEHRASARIGSQAQEGRRSPEPDEREAQ